MIGRYEEDLKEIIASQDREIASFRKQLAAAEKILYRLARLARNTDGLFPTMKAKEVAKELLALRRLDCARYDREIIADKEPEDVKFDGPWDEKIDPAAAAITLASRKKPASRDRQLFIPLGRYGYDD